MTAGVDEYLGVAGTAADLEALPRVELTPRLKPLAYHGLTGRIIEAVQPYTEADPAAVFGHLIAAAGNMLWPAPYVHAGNARHYARFFVAIVGTTAKARKGSAWAAIEPVLKLTDTEWAVCRVGSGLSSGEGLIYAVRDEHRASRRDKETGAMVEEVVDSGVTDKRFLAIEQEMSSTLKRMSRETNTLSEIIRVGWDGGTLQTQTKNTPLRATGAHLGIVGHITQEELRACLTETDAVNGFGNRFLWHLVSRSRLLPDGVPVPAEIMGPLAVELAAVKRFAASLGDTPIQRSPAAAEVWRSLYAGFNDDSQSSGSLVDRITARSDAQALRLSLFYALMDRSTMILPQHLLAAAAAIDYVEICARRIFGGRLGFTLLDTFVQAHRDRGEMTETAQVGMFKGRANRDALDGLRRQAHERGLLRIKEVRQTGGRPQRVWAPVRTAEA